MRTTRALLTAALAASTILAGTQGASATTSGVSQVRASTAAFHDISVAIAAGWSIDRHDLAGIDCIDSPAGAWASTSSTARWSATAQPREGTSRGTAVPRHGRGPRDPGPWCRRSPPQSTYTSENSTGRPERSLPGTSSPGRARAAAVAVVGEV